MSARQKGARAVNHRRADRVEITLAEQEQEQEQGRAIVELRVQAWN